MYLWNRESGDWVPEKHDENFSLGSAKLHKFQSLAGEKWCLVSTGSDTRINGEELTLGIRVLEHRDDIRIGDRWFIVSTESLPAVEPAPTDDFTCGRCRNAIKAQTPMVICPGCKTACHQSEERMCFTYAATCPHCEQSTDLNGEFRFQPAKEGW